MTLRETLYDQSRIVLIDKNILHWPETHGDIADWILAMPDVTVLDDKEIRAQHRCIDTADRYLDECLQCVKCNADWPCEVIKLVGVK